MSLYSVFIHANLSFDMGKWRYIFATPQFHHWHHGADEEAIDKNFAVHFPVLDMLFGTFLMPGTRWPVSYGVNGEAVPMSFVKQLAYPFKRNKKS